MSRTFTITFENVTLSEAYILEGAINREADQLLINADGQPQPATAPTAPFLTPSSFEKTPPGQDPEWFLKKSQSEPRVKRKKSHPPGAKIRLVSVRPPLSKRLYASALCVEQALIKYSALKPEFTRKEFSDWYGTVRKDNWPKTSSVSPTLSALLKLNVIEAVDAKT